MADVISLYERSGDPQHVTPEQCMEEFLTDMKDMRGGIKCNKLIVLGVDDRQDEFVVHSRRARMSSVEAISYLEYAKAMIISGMDMGAREEDGE